MTTAESAGAFHEERRAAVVAEALTWLKTPWHHMARVKGEGVDCAQFLIGVYAAAGLVPAFKTGNYPPDWNLHKEEPRFLAFLKQYADPIEGPPLPGDVAMFKFGQQDAHGSIVLEWPRIVHAYYAERMVICSDVSTNLQLAKRFAGFWRLRAFS